MDWQRRLVFTMLDVMARYSVNLNLICKAEFCKSLDFQEWWLEMCSKILLNILRKCTNEGENCNISQIPCKILILQKAIHFVVHVTTTKSWNRLGRMWNKNRERRWLWETLWLFCCFTWRCSLLYEVYVFMLMCCVKHFEIADYFFCKLGLGETN